METVKTRLSKELKNEGAGPSIEQLIAERRWTEGGLQELRTLLLAGWDYFDSLVAISQAGCSLDACQLAFGLRFTVASLYALEECARAMVLEKVLLAGK
jgi:hypothetical protein